MSAEETNVTLLLDTGKQLQCLTVIDTEHNLVDYAILHELELDDSDDLYLVLVKHLYIKEPDSEILIARYDSANGTLEDITDDDIWQRLLEKMAELDAAPRLDFTDEETVD